MPIGRSVCCVLLVLGLTLFSYGKPIEHNIHSSLWACNRKMRRALWYAAHIAHMLLIFGGLAMFPRKFAIFCVALAAVPVSRAQNAGVDDATRLSCLRSLRLTNISIATLSCRITKKRLLRSSPDRKSTRLNSSHLGI